jgi:hypothetical protein
MKDNSTDQQTQQKREILRFVIKYVTDLFRYGHGRNKPRYDLFAFEINTFLNPKFQIGILKE